MGRKGWNNKVDIIADQLLKQECRVISESSVSNCWRIPWNVNR